MGKGKVWRKGRGVASYHEVIMNSDDADDSAVLWVEASLLPFEVVPYFLPGRMRFSRC